MCILCVHMHEKTHPHMCTHTQAKEDGDERAEEEEGFEEASQTAGKGQAGFPVCCPMPASGLFQSHAFPLRKLRR